MRVCAACGGRNKKPDGFIRHVHVQHLLVTNSLSVLSLSLKMIQNSPFWFRLLYNNLTLAFSFVILYVNTIPSSLTDWNKTHSFCSIGSILIGANRRNLAAKQDYVLL